MIINKKILSKFVGWFQFKLIEKDLIKNNKSISKYNFLNINFVLNYFFENDRVNSILQIGANDGQRFDLLNKFIKKKKIKSLLIEPIKENFLELERNYMNYQNVTLLNMAISDKQDEKYEIFKVNKEFYNNYDEHIKGVNSFDINHLLKHGVKSKHIVKEKVDSISIKEIFTNYLENVDLIYIDVEGYDGNIVLDFFKNVNLRPYIIFEYIHIKNYIFENVLKILNENNYIFFSVEENLICIPVEKKIIFQSNPHI